MRTGKPGQAHAPRRPDSSRRGRLWRHARFERLEDRRLLRPGVRALVAADAALPLAATPPAGIAAGSPGAVLVPGPPGQVVPTTFVLAARQTRFRNEVGIFPVDDASGRIGGLLPGDAGYAAAALARRVVLAGSGYGAGESLTVDLPGGSYYGLYLVQNSSAERFLARNPADALRGAPLAFFSFPAANPDRFAHVAAFGGDVFGWEDLTGGGDRDFNDAVVAVAYGAPTPPADTLAPVVAIGAPANGSVTDHAITIAGLVADDLSGVKSVQGRWLVGTAVGDLFDIPFDRARGTFILPAGLPLDGTNDGTWTLQVRATDNAGNVSAFVSSTVTLDTRAPVVAVRTPAQGQQTATNVVVAGAVADATSGVARLRAEVDSGPFFDVAVGAGGAFSFPTALVPGKGDGVHHVDLVATDRAGNDSAPKSVAFTLDATAPTITLTAPGPGVLVELPPAVTGRVTDNLTGVASLTARVDSGPAVPVAFDPSGRFSFRPGSLRDGIHTVTFQATDRVKNSSKAPLAFIVDATPPAIVITLPAVPPITNGNPTLTGSAKDLLSGLKSLQAQVDGGPLVAVPFGPSGSFAFTTALPLDHSADGNHTVTFRATDGAGNSSTIKTSAFILDTTPPALTLALDPASDTDPVGDGQTMLAAATLAGRTEPGLTVTLVETGATAIADTTGHFAFPGVALAPGANTFHARTSDAAGNPAEASTTVTRTDCDFDDLTGWTVAEQGGTSSGKGTVAVQGDRVVLREGDSFTVTLSRTFVVPAGATSLSFTYDDFFFDTTDTSSIHDAFEAELLDASGQTLVHSIGAGRDAYFNATEGLPAALGQEAALANRTVTLDLSGISVGTAATLVLRLVNNDSDHGTTVAITCVDLPGDSTSQAAARATVLGGAGAGTATTTTTASVAIPTGAASGAAAGTSAPSGAADNGPASPRSAASALAVAPQPTSTITVEVGYADNLRASPFFPNPWNGSPKTVFVGSTSGGIDAGAIRIINNGVEPVTINDVVVTLAGGQRLDLWGSHVVPAGWDLILTQSTAYDFDTSDFGTLPFPQTYPDGETAHAAHIDITANGAALPTFLDTGHVLTTGGSDLAAGGANESLNWRPVGTTGVIDPGGTQAYTVRVDASAPEDSAQAGSQVLISGHAESVRDDGAATRTIALVTVGGVPVDALDASGNFFARVTVAPGQATYTIVAIDASGQSSSTTLDLEGVQPDPSQVDFSLFSDVSASFRAGYGRTSFNQGSSTLYADALVRNTGQYRADAPLIVGVKNISDPTVHLIGIDGYLPDGTPYYDFTAQMAGTTLAPGGSTEYQSLAFADPGRVQFTYDLVFLGKLDQAPSITSVPVVEAVSGRPYTYAASAADPDGDTLTYSLVVHPDGMSVDPATGRITWSPAAADVGTHDVTLHVEDGRGGFAEQRFVVAAIAPPPNRPPVFTSVPVVAANVGTAYVYQATAADPDGDPLTFAVAAPAGLVIDSHTGAVTWTPTSGDLGSQGVSLTVTDGNGGTATQSFVVLVQQTVGNHSPVIISQPVTALVLPAPEQAVGGSIFLTGHDPDDHAQAGLGGNAAGAQDINKTAIRFVTDPKFNSFAAHGVSKFLFVESKISPPGGHTDGINGLIASGYKPGVDFDLSDATTLNASLDKLGTTYDALVVASDFGGILTQAELDILDSRSADIIRFLNASGGLYAMAESNNGAHLTPGGGRFGYLPFVTTSTPLDQSENGVILTSFGAGLGLTTADVNGNFSHNVFDGDFGLNVVDRDSQNRILTLAGRGQVTQSGVGAAYNYDVDAIDADEDSLTYTLIVKPDGMTIVPATGRVSWSTKPSDAGAHNVTVRVDDGRGGSATQSFTINVSNATPATIQGSVFNDLDDNGARNWGQLLVSAAPSDRVLRYDGQTGALMDEFIPPGSGGLENPFDFVFGPDGDLYVTSAFDGAVLRYDGHTGAFLGQFVKPGSGGLESPTALTFAPNGTLLVNDNFTGRVLRYNGQTGAFLGVFIQQGAGNGFNAYSSLVIGADGLLYAASGPVSAPGRILRFNADTGAFIDAFVPAGLFVPQTINGTTYGSAADIAFGRDGRLYVLDRSQNRVLRFDGQTGALIDVFISGNGLKQPSEMTFGPDGDLYISNEQADNILKFDGCTGAFLGVVATGLNKPERALFTPDSEPTLAGWVVYLDDNHNGRRDPGERFTTTDVCGDYSFPNLAAGTYTVAEELQPGWIETSPAGKTFTITVQSGQVVSGMDFGNTQSAETPPNHPPAFTSNVPSAAVVGQLLRYDASATDLDGDPLTYDLVVKPDGMAVDPTSGVLVWVPGADQEGAHDVVLRVQDGRDGVALQDFQVVVTRANTGPVITSTPRGPAVAGHPYQYQATAQDADGDPITFSLGAHPTGMAIDPATGLVTWTPTAGQVGSPHVEVTADDGRGGSTTQSFDLPTVATAADNPPRITSAPRGSVRLGSTYSYPVVATDPDGDPLTYSLLAKPDGMTIEPGTGVIAWKPSAGQVGVNAVQVRVDDGRGGFATQSFSLVVLTSSVDSPPTITSTPTFAATAGKTYAYDLRGSDPDGDPLAWSLDAFPTGMSINPVTGSLRWIPTADQVGQAPVVVRVVDGQGGFATQSFTLVVRGVNLPPSISSTPPTSAFVGDPYTYAVRATDPDGDPLAFSLVSPPAGMAIDTGTGLVSWTPGAAQTGPFAVVVRVDDGQGGVATQPYTVVVSAAAPSGYPVITSTPVFIATVGAAYTYQVTASDPAGGALGFQLLAWPAGMAIDPDTGLVTWTPTASQVGTSTVTVAAVNDSGHGGTQTYTITVLPPDRAPTISSTPPTTVAAGAPYRYDVQASDPDGDPLSYSLSGAPKGMAVDALGRVTWATSNADAGSYHVVLTVDDGRGLTATQAIDLVVRADTQAPKVGLIVSPDRAPAGTPIGVIASASDDVGVVSRSITVNGVPIPLDPAGHATLTGLPAGTYTIVATATDAAGNVGSASHTLTLLVPDPTAPDVDITSPDDGATVTNLIDVMGTAKDDNLSSYTLSIAPQGGSFTQIAQGTSSVDKGVLGRLDPTGLANGTYTLELKAVDLANNVSTIDTTFDVSGDLKLGNFTLSFTDLTIPVSGIPITVTRTYDSLNAGTSGDFGFGWRLEFRDTDLRTSVPAPTPDEADAGVFSPYRDGTHIYLTLPGGRREGFTFKAVPAPGFAGKFFGLTNPTFVPDRGVTDALSAAGATLVQGDDGGYYSANGLPYNPADTLNFGGVFTVTTVDGLAYTINAVSGLLDRVSDANGNTLTFTDSDITSSAGPRVVFGRDPKGRIVSATDPAGKSVLYKYDKNDDLVAVTDRQGNTTTFVYAAPGRPHFLTEVKDPLGRTGVRTEYDAQGRLITLRDAAGNPVQIDYDTAASVETVKDALGNSTVYVYDEFGNVIDEIDALGGHTRRTYDGNNNVLTETDPDGRTTVNTYDGTNLITTTDPLGNVTRNTYVTSVPGFFARIAGARPVSYLASTTDPLGNTTYYTYDGAGNLITTKDASGHTTVYTYDGAGNQTSIQDANGQTTFFEYDGAGHLMKQTDALGHVTTYTYDADGNQRTQTTTLTTPAGVRTLVTKTAYDTSGHPTSVTDAEGGVTRTEYDTLGRQSATVDALGNRTVFVYDARGQLVETDFADGTKTTTTYDLDGRRIASTDRGRRETRYVYDVLGRLTQTIEPDDTGNNPTTKTEYDAAGQVTAQVDELGHRTEFGYDLDGRQVLVRDALGDQTTTAYDAAGRRTSTTDPLGNKTAFVYDTLGRLTETDFADGTKTTTGYDALGRAVVQTDQLGRSTGFTYDALGRLTAVEDALLQFTRYGYDEAGDLVTQTDANGHTTSYEYDGLGRRTATVLPMGQRSTTAYDAAGNVKSTTDFNGQTITFQYDTNNRLKTETLPDHTAVSFTYTPDGQRATETDGRRATTTNPLGTTVYAYDARDRLVSRVDPDGTRISYTYDAAGNRTSITIPAGTTRYTFDELNRTKSVTGPGGGVTGYTYDADGRLVKTTLPNGTSETRQYDKVGHLTYLEDDGPSGVIASYRYTLAATGRRDAVVEDTGRRVDYSYDALDRLLAETITDPARGNRTIAYTYDPVGNRLTRNDSAEGVTTSTYDANDRLLKETLGSQVTQYTYDADGNTLTKFTSAVDQALYDWDAQGRMVGATVTDATGTHHIVYRYDADGIRVASVVDGSETRYLIDANQPYAQVLEEYTPGGVIQVSYVYGNDLISQNRGGALSYYHVDGLGSTRALTNSAGAVTDRYVYDAFGRTIGQVGTTTNSYLFAGEQRDANVGLDYLRARYLSAGTGRFYGSDTFAGALRSPESLHRFLYTNNNPVNMTDPTGLFSIAEAVAAFSVLSGLANLTSPRFITPTSTGTATLYVRAFAPWPTFGYGYAGDNRSFSTSLRVTSRITARVDFDAKTHIIRSSSVRADISRAGPFGAVGIPSLDVRRTPSGLMIDVAGSNPLFAFSPDIDLHLVVSSSVGPNGFSFGGSLTGDGFPDAEVFVVRNARATMLLTFTTSGDRQNGPRLLFGDFKRPMGTFAVTV